MARENKWWTVITGASRFISDIADAAEEGESVIIKNSCQIPFFDEMKNTMMEKIASSIFDRSIKYFDCSQPKELSVEEYLCRHYCPEDYYIPAKGFSRVDFLVRSKMFEINNSILVIDRPDSKQEQEWISLICDYCRRASKENRLDKAQFILIAAEDKTIQKAKQCRILQLSDYVTEYDYYVYCLLAIPESCKMGLQMKQYISEIASGLCLKNPSLIFELLNDPEALYKDTYRYYNSLADNKLSEAEINKVLWKAQLKVVFPILESFRCFLAEKYRKQLETKIPYSTKYKDITEVDSLELVHILEINYSLKMLSQDEFNRLKIYRDIRNQIAHMDAADASGIEVVLSEA